MTRIRVPVHGAPLKSVLIASDAPSQADVTAQIAAAVAGIQTQTTVYNSGNANTSQITLWSLISGVPTNLVDIGELSGTGLLYDDDGTWELKTGLTDGSTVSIFTLTEPLEFTLKTQDANYVFAGPTSGSAAEPTFRALVAADIPDLSMTNTYIKGATWSGGGSAIVVADAPVVYVQCSTAGTIEEVTLLGNTSGSCEIDIWKVPYADFPPTSANSICDSNYPALSSATNGQETPPEGWTTSINAGDILAFSLTSCSTFSQLSIMLEISSTVNT